jgi:hypothetical protein
MCIQNIVGVEGCLNKSLDPGKILGLWIQIQKYIRMFNKLKLKTFFS